MFSTGDYQYSVIYINQATKQDSWNGSFHSILLHSLFEHLSLNSKNIKKFLCHITNYIKYKGINHTKVNDILNLNSIGKVI